MIDRVLLLSLAGCVVFGTLLLFELNPSEVRNPAVVPPPGRAEARPAPSANPQIDELVGTVLGRPLFSATRRPPERANTNAAAVSELPDVRLSGIFIEAGRHLAIFAMPGGKPLVRVEGETVKDWRLDSIASRQVSLSGPSGGTLMLEPKVDPNLVRPPPPRPAGAAPGQPVAIARPAAPAPGQPAAIDRPPAPAPGQPTAFPRLPAPAPGQPVAFPRLPAQAPAPGQPVAVPRPTPVRPQPLSLPQ